MKFFDKQTIKDEAPWGIMFILVFLWAMIFVKGAAQGMRAYMKQHLTNQVEHVVGK